MALTGAFRTWVISDCFDRMPFYGLAHYAQSRRHQQAARISSASQVSRAAPGEAPS